VIFSAVFLSADGFVSRFDSIILIMLWFTAMLLSKRLSKEKITVEKSEEMVVKEKRSSNTIMFLLIGFVGISVGSYLVIESIISISSVLGISEYFISFFLLSLSTSLPELMVAISAIKKGYFELAVGDIIGSCIVDATLSIGIGSLLFPIKMNGSHILVTGLYAGLVSSIIVSLLSYRQVNDKKSGALFLILYLITWIIPILL
jgi:cation:H+ antiporter